MMYKIRASLISCIMSLFLFVNANAMNQPYAQLASLGNQDEQKESPAARAPITPSQALQNLADFALESKIAELSKSRGLPAPFTSQTQVLESVKQSLAVKKLVQDFNTKIDAEVEQKTRQLRFELDLLRHHETASKMAACGGVLFGVACLITVAVKCGPTSKPHSPPAVFIPCTIPATINPEAPTPPCFSPCVAFGGKPNLCDQNNYQSGNTSTQEMINKVMANYNGASGACLAQRDCSDPIPYPENKALALAKRNEPSQRQQTRLNNLRTHKHHQRTPTGILKTRKERK